MARTLTELDSLTELLDASRRPIYAVNKRRQIVYCNQPLARWLDLRRNRIVGRLVEYHSEPGSDGPTQNDSSAPLTDLCPPPRALAGEHCIGTISCLGRDGRLIHRRAQFIPLDPGDEPSAGRPSKSDVLVFLSARDLTPQELASQLSGDPPADELHRTIRQFRRGEAARYAIPSILGETSAMRKVRSQVAVAALSGANTLIWGRPGTGRGHVARAIHYRTAGDADIKFVPVDCAVANADLLRQAVNSVSSTSEADRSRATLVLENLDRLGASLQTQLTAALRQNSFTARVLATCNRRVPADIEHGERNEEVSAEGSTTEEAGPLDAELLDALSTISIHVPRLCERLNDLPILAQLFLEAANRDHGKQVGSIRSDALDLLAIYTWPGELHELREVIAAAHSASSSHEITPSDLPAVVHHAAKSAVRVRRQPERIVLDELLANIEKEAITRALDQTGGNKTEAAELLGMTRPRLYRRLVQLGLAGPEFIEREPTDDSV